MGYSKDDANVRVDFFKESGKWYDTIDVHMKGYNSPSPHGSLMKTLNEALYLPEVNRLRYSGMTAVCLEPYHKYAYPLMLTLPSEGKFDLSDFQEEFPSTPNCEPDFND